MQTFLPYPDYRDSAACLDNRRLGKQRVEAKQILLALGIDIGNHKGNAQSSWRNHPATKMWRGHERSLCHYAAIMCNEWLSRGFKDTLLMQFVDAYMELRGVDQSSAPAWLGDEAVHSSHRSNLLRKLPEHYGQFGWHEPATLPYFWPT